MLWSWERREDLRIVDPRRLGDAGLAVTVTLNGEHASGRPRAVPLRMPPGISPIEALGQGVDVMYRRVLPWARTHPKDLRVPDMLARAVHAAKGICGSARTKGYSRDAFRLLKARHPQSEAAKRTLYGYGS